MYSIEDIERNLLVTQKTNDGEPWMLTASGNILSFHDPQPKQVTLFDICHHLGRVQRFTGAINRECYSVAQHSLLATAIAKRALDSEAAVDRHSVEYFDQLLATALHDSEEYAVNDLSSPLKRAIAPSKYKWIAVGIRQVVYIKFGVDWAYYNDMVKLADLNALVVERAVMLPKSPEWPKMPRERLFCTSLPHMSADESAGHLEDLIRQLLEARRIARREEKDAAPRGSTAS